MITVRCLLFAAVLAALFLAGCQAANPPPPPASQRDHTAANTWIARREAQLKQMGLSEGDAALKARQEWTNLGNSTESYTIFDSQADERAKQEKFEQDLSRARKN